MKKLLSILGVLSLSSLGINSVIACKGPESSTRKQTFDDENQISDDETQISDDENQEQPVDLNAPVSEAQDEDKISDADKKELTLPKRDLRFDISQLNFDGSYPFQNNEISNIWNYKFDDELENELKIEIKDKFLRKLSGRASYLRISESDYKIEKVSQIDSEFSKEFIFSIKAESTSLQIKGQINEIKINFRQKSFIDFIKYRWTKWVLPVGNNEHVSVDEASTIVAAMKEKIGVPILEKVGFNENQHYEIKNLDQIQAGDLSSDIILTVAGKQGSVLENLPSVDIVLTISDKRVNLNRFEYLDGELAYTGINNLRAINPSNITALEADFFCKELKKSIQNAIDKSYRLGVDPEFDVDYTIRGLEKIKPGADLSETFWLDVVVKPESKLLYGMSDPIRVQIQKETRIDISGIKVGPYNWSISSWEKNKIWDELSGIENMKAAIRNSISQKISKIAPVVTTPDQNYRVIGLGKLSRQDTRGKNITITVEALSLVSKHIYGSFSFNVIIKN